MSPYDIGNTAFVVTDETRPLASEYSIAVRDMLGSLHTPGIDTYFLDMVSLLDTVQENAEAFGFDFLTGAEAATRVPQPRSAGPRRASTCRRPNRTATSSRTSST